LFLKIVEILNLWIESLKTEQYLKRRTELEKKLSTRPCFIIERESVDVHQIIRLYGFRDVVQCVRSRPFRAYTFLNVFIVLPFVVQCADGNPMSAHACLIVGDRQTCPRLILVIGASGARRPNNSLQATTGETVINLIRF
jgi:hypothetical protein